MKELNKEFNGELDLAIAIFSDKYHKKFLHQLVFSIQALQNGADLNQMKTNIKLWR